MTTLYKKVDLYQQAVICMLITARLNRSKQLKEAIRGMKLRSEF